MSRIQAWLSGRRSFLTKNGSLKPGDPDGSLQPARLAPQDPQSAPPTALDSTTTTGRFDVFPVGGSPIEYWPTRGFTLTGTTGTPTNQSTEPHCQCHGSPSVACAADES